VSPYSRLDQLVTSTFLGEWEYEYAQPQIVNDQGLQPTPYTPRGSEANIAGLPSIDEHNVQYQEENEPNYSIAGITQGMENTQLEEQSKRTRKGKSKRKGYCRKSSPVDHLPIIIYADLFTE
jgi:hypothetical protein